MSNGGVTGEACLGTDSTTVRSPGAGESRAERQAQRQHHFSGHPQASTVDMIPSAHTPPPPSEEAGDLRINKNKNRKRQLGPPVCKPKFI